MLCLVVTGCQSPSKMSALSLWRPNPDHDELLNTNDIHGPLERMLQARQASQTSLKNALIPEEDLKRYQAAETLFQEQKYAEAERAFRKLLKEQRSQTGFKFLVLNGAKGSKKGRYEHSQLVEDLMFMIAECQFHRNRYPAAQDGYERLLKDYPSSRYMDRVTRRLFTIARSWLELPEFPETGEVQQVDFEAPASTDPSEQSSQEGSNGGWDPSRRIPIVPNVWDRSRPVFDTKGRALQALKSIWLNDPTGPLADDALLMTAVHYLRKGDFLEADRLLTTLREEYPNSPHLQEAFVLGSHVKLMSYQGPRYDGKSLKEARELKESTLRLYPQHPDRERFLEEIRNIDESKAQRDWEVVEFYDRKNKPKAMAVYCRLILKDHPETKYADLARQKLAELEPQLSDEPESTATEPPPERPYEEASPEAPAAAPLNRPADDAPGRAKL